jgi:four helix bundle protein
LNKSENLQIVKFKNALQRMRSFKTEENPILKLTKEFALGIIDYCARLEELRKYPLATQLFKSGTSIGANAHEAQHAESKADFIHKFKIAAKEMYETAYWLELCSQSEHLPDCKELIAQLTVIEKVINKIIASSKKIEG